MACRVQGNGLGKLTEPWCPQSLYDSPSRYDPPSLYEILRALYENSRSEFSSRTQSMQALPYRGSSLIRNPAQERWEAYGEDDPLLLEEEGRPKKERRRSSKGSVPCLNPAP